MTQIDELVARARSLCDGPDDLPAHILSGELRSLADAIESQAAQSAKDAARIAELEAQERAEELSHLNTIDQRDAAEQFAGDVYFSVVGRPVEWSNVFGYKEASEEIADCIAALEAQLEAFRKAATALRNDCYDCWSSKGMRVSVPDTDFDALMSALRNAEGGKDGE